MMFDGSPTSKWCTGNTENEVTIELPLDALVSAQVCRFVVDQYVQPGAQYGAVRVYEMAFYGCTGLTEIDLASDVTIEDWAFSKVPGWNP